jgi:hypothetical protein
MVDGTFDLDFVARIVTDFQNLGTELKGMLVFLSIILMGTVKEGKEESNAAVICFVSAVMDNEVFANSVQSLTTIIESTAQKLPVRNSFFYIFLWMTIELMQLLLKFLLDGFGRN